MHAESPGVMDDADDLFDFGIEDAGVLRVRDHKPSGPLRYRGLDRRSCDVSAGAWIKRDHLETCRSRRGGVSRVRQDGGQYLVAVRFALRLVVGANHASIRVNAVCATTRLQAEAGHARQ